MLQATSLQRQGNRISTIKHKVVKLVRRFRAMPARAGNLPVSWHIGRPNFGDDLNPLFWSTLTERPVRLATRRSKRTRPHALGIGSILETATEHSIVFGSGFLCADSGESVCAGRVLAIRGQLTADRLTMAPEYLGDPAVVVDLVFPQQRQVEHQVEHQVGLIPHFSQKEKFQDLATSGAYLIDPAWPPSRVLEAICRCERVFSQSLHGLIIADAFGVPNGWVAPSDSMKGGDFKFRDYYTTTDRGKIAIPLARLSDAITAKSVDVFVSRYRFEKQSYMAAIRKAAADHFPKNCDALT